MNIFTRNLKNKGIALGICGGVYLVLMLLSATLLNSTYMFGWMSENSHCYTWVLALAFIVFDKTVLAYFVTFGNLIGDVVGHVLGDILKSIAWSKVTPDMDDGTIYLSTAHQGVFIWGIILFVSIVLGIIAEIIIHNKKRKNPAAA